MDLFNLNNIVENKRVIIIGPSPSLLKFNNGSIYDDYDIVIRIKRGFPVPDNLKLNLGEKIDILCSHLKLSQNNLEYSDLDVLYTTNCQCIYLPYPVQIQPFQRFYQNFLSYYQEYLSKRNYQKVIPVFTHPNLNLYNYHCKKMNTTPTTGMAMILELLNCHYKELFITGFTFRLDGYYPEYKTKEQDTESYIRTCIKRPIHNLNSEMIYMKELLFKKKHIHLDEILYSIFKDSK